jgi:hypothetical protein
MRTRQKLTAVGAVALASTAMGGGALATSHAMADSATPAKGTMTVISMTADSGGAFKCVYDNIDLPTVGVGTGVPAPGGAPTEVAGQAFNVVTGTGPVDANGKPIAGSVLVSSGSMQLPDGAVPPAGAPTLVVASATADGSATEGGTSTAGAGETTQAGPVLSGAPPGMPIAIDSVNARPGTAEECAAMKPTTITAPPSAP